MSVRGKNLADKLYATKPLDLSAGFGYDPTHIGLPRMFGIGYIFRS